MMRALTAWVAAAMVLAPRGAVADDADLIPGGVLDGSPKPESSGQGSQLHLKLFLEGAFTGYDDEAVVPRSPVPAGAWQDRTSFDTHLEWVPSGSLSLTFSDRLNLYFQDGQSFLSPNTFRNDFREGYLTWQPRTGLFLEAGRINVRNGVALGFNPTDFFKTGTLVGQASLDPSVIRQNRLGTIMVRSQAIWSRGAASIAYAPRLASLTATNYAHRLLATIGFDALDLSPQLLGYFEEGRSKAGLNLSHPIGDATIVYAEWAGGPEKNLITRAIDLGREVGTLPETAPLVPATTTKASFRNDVAAGLSWTIATKVALNAEYHFHEAGFGREQWKDWFDLGSAPGAPAALASELWYIRAYASDEQEPVTQHQLFVRASWPRALLPDLELTAFAFVNLPDGSVLSQLSASYYLSNRWTASVHLSGSFGPMRSEHGSFPERVGSIAQLTLYL